MTLRFVGSRKHPMECVRKLLVDALPKVRVDKISASTSLDPETGQSRQIYAQNSPSMGDFPISERNG